MEDNPAKAGFVPTVDEYGETSVPGIYAAGDVSGIEEASSAMIEGRIAGIAAAARLGFISEETCKEEAAKQEAALAGLRQGMFAPGMRGKQITETEEGVEISQNLLKHGFVAEEEIERFPGVTHSSGVHPVIECTQNIPCNPMSGCLPQALHPHWQQHHSAAGNRPGEKMHWLRNVRGILFRSGNFPGQRGLRRRHRRSDIAI